MYIHSPLSKKHIHTNRRRIKQPAGPQTGGRYSQHAFTSAKQVQKKGALTAIRPWQVICFVLTLGILGTLYLTHVFKTQQILRDVQQLEVEYKKAQRIYHEKKLMHDRLTGPTFIYPKAKELGFVNGVPSIKVLEVNQ